MSESDHLHPKYVDKNRDQDSLNWQMLQGWSLKLKRSAGSARPGSFTELALHPTASRAGPVQVPSGDFRKHDWSRHNSGGSMEIKFTARVPARAQLDASGAYSLERRKLWIINLSFPRTGTGSDSASVSQAPVEVPGGHIQPLCCQIELCPSVAEED